MKKLFTLSMMLFALVASVKAAVIWEGEKEVNWAADNLAISADKFASAQENDVLKITCRRAVANVWGGIEIGCGGSTVAVQQTIPTNDECELEWILTADQAAMFAANGISVVGAGAIVTKVELIGAAGYGVIWEGSQAISWEPDLVLSPSSFAVAKEGDKLVVTAQRPAPDAWGAVQVNSNWNVNLPQQTMSTNDVCELEWELTAEQVDKLKAYGGSVLGAGIVTKIELLEGAAAGEDPVDPDPVDPNIDENTIWAGKAVCNSWESALNLDGSHFEKVKAGDKLEFYLTVNNPAEWAGLQVDNGNWTQGALSAARGITADDTMLSYDINATAAEELHQYGINLTGMNYTLTRIQHVPDTSGIAAVEADAQTDNVIYNLQGVRVCGDLPAGIYVKAGKKFLVK